MRWESMKKQVATVAALALVGSVGAVSLNVGPAAAAVPSAQSTTAFCVNAPAGFGGFTDIADNVHRRTIECLAYSEITQGKTATTYAPSDPVRRGQMASFIARAIDRANELENINLPSLPANPPNKFSDDNGNIHEANINRLAQAGIVSGTTATTFSPSAIVTRGQMASFINNAQRFLSGGQAPFITNNDYFVDDETSVHEANINGIAAAGITAGVDATHYAPNNPVLRANMATFITRYLAVLHKSGSIDPLPPATNATLAISPTTAARLMAVTEPSTADDRVYTATGLAAGSYRVTLVQSSLVTKTNNTYTFTEDGSTNLANAGTVGGQIVAVNGSAVTPAQSVGGINAVNGSVTFSVDAVDYSKLLPVIYTDQGGENTRLNLDAQNRPTEPFGVGGEVETVPVAASTGSLGADATVVFADEANNLIVGQIASTQRTYLYDANDTFQRAGSPPEPLTLAQFEAALSKDDRLDATTIYQSVAASSSVFVLENVSPPAPSAAVVTPVPEREATITVSNLITGATVKVYLGPDNASFKDAPLKATTSADADAATPGFQVKLTNLTPGTSYEFYVTQTVDGEESDPTTTVPGTGTNLTTAAATPPTVLSVNRISSTVFNFNWSEAVTPIAGQHAKYTVQCGPLGLIPTFSATGTKVEVIGGDADSLAVTFSAAVPAVDGVLTVCTAAVAAGAVQDGTGNQNAALSGINVP